MADVFAEGQFLDTANDNPNKRYRIGDVARLLDLKPHVLRYWETEFASFILGEKTDGGQRLYSQKDIEFFGRVKQLLYKEGYSISGARKRLSGKDAEINEQEQQPAVPKELLSVIKEELEDIRDGISKLRSSLEDIQPPL